MPSPLIDLSSWRLALYSAGYAPLHNAHAASHARRPAAHSRIQQPAAHPDPSSLDILYPRCYHAGRSSMCGAGRLATHGSPACQWCAVAPAILQLQDDSRIFDQRNDLCCAAVYGRPNAGVCGAASEGGSAANSRLGNLAWSLPQCTSLVCTESTSAAQGFWALRSCDTITLSFAGQVSGPGAGRAALRAFLFAAHAHRHCSPAHCSCKH